MKTAKEIRDEIEYLIDKHFTDSNSNYNKFLDWFEPINYFQDICDDQSYDSYDLEKFSDDAYKSYNDFFYDFYTEKYLDNKSDYELLEYIDGENCSDDYDPYIQYTTDTCCLMVDMAHIAGLVAADEYNNQNPFQKAFP